MLKCSLLALLVALPIAQHVYAMLATMATGHIALPARPAPQTLQLGIVAMARPPMTLARAHAMLDSMVMVRCVFLAAVLTRIRKSKLPARLAAQLTIQSVFVMPTFTATTPIAQRAGHAD
jgi:hypothetical protein